MVAVLGAHPQESSKEPAEADPILGNRIAEAVVFDGRLWLRGTMISRADESGGLVSLAVADDSREVHFERGVLDIEKANDALWVLHVDSSRGRSLVVSVWRGGRFEELTRFRASAKENPIALFNKAGTPTVLFEKSFHVFSSERRAWNRVRLKGKLRSGVQIVVAAPERSDSIYVGINMGEWGGGLQRVDLRTGSVTNVERRDSQELCEGPLNSDCDPVTGVIPDLEDKNCVLAAVGLVHFDSTGRLLKVCGDRVTVISEFAVKNGDSRRRSTEAFFGLAPAGEGGFWAVTSRAVYRFNPDGKVQERHTLPRLQSVSGVYLSRQIPGVIVVGTDVNWAVSVSGYTPLVAPLNGE